MSDLARPRHHLVHRLARPAARGWLLAAVLLGNVGLAEAGGSATFVAGDDLSDPTAQMVRSRIEFDRPTRVRLQVDPTAEFTLDGYLVVRDSTAYAVANLQEQTMVFEYEQAMASLGGIARNLAPRSLVTDGRFVSLEGPGRSETIAGFAGRVWLLTTENRAGQRRTDEIVLTRDPRVQELTEALLATGRIAAKALPELDAEANERLAAELRQRGTGILRIGNSFLLERLDPATPVAARFALPAEPSVLPNLRSFGSLFGQ